MRTTIPSQSTNVELQPSTCSTEGDIRRESRVIFTLLDAADEQGLINDRREESRWRSVYARLLQRSDYEGEARELYELMSTLDHSGVLDGTWIQQRWHLIRTRVDSVSK
jgi:hypothetical protein